MSVERVPGSRYRYWAEPRDHLLPVGAAAVAARHPINDGGTCPVPPTGVCPACASSTPDPPGPGRTRSCGRGRPVRPGEEALWPATTDDGSRRK
ncbi:MAG: hypothetical protein AVDCRST_MAG66-1458 [uncultured Pseudonocardia sp.]|uniref:Uncharacterized protein n=1 Tax=uncultured Pseudonocardia sp. TaxID=211455 RepID=A0A6J4P4D0_9PSEU|nr:MAG: hypothetical protein AVDCRST_MAG66-1458 [uncultured Pseudonocardia sp.]